jgi:hypothetical protein
VAGAAYLLYSISSSISVAPSILQRLHDLNLSVSSFVNDVLILGQRSSETSIFLLLLGTLTWATGLFGAFSVFRSRRPLPAIVAAAVVLLINVSLTIRDEYLHLVVFMVAALVLLVRLNLLEQVHEWRSRGMRDIPGISSVFMRNGAVFIAVAVVASSGLAATASSAPLSRAWHNADDQLLELGYAVNRWLGGVTGSARGPNVLFTPVQTIRDLWQSSSEVVFTARVSDSIGRRWRGQTYDSYDGLDWRSLDTQSQVLPAGAEILSATTEPVPKDQGLVPITVTVTPNDYGGDVFVTPANPLSVDQPSEVLTHGTDGPFVAAKLSYGVQQDVPYNVRVLVRPTTGPFALTAAKLARAGTNYASWISRYLDVRPGSMGPEAYDLANRIVAGLPSGQRDPYHIAAAVQDYLYRAGGFTYNTDMRGLCDGDKVVDCFLRTKQGFCEYFATTMVMLLRADGVPARYVVGYLPGQEQGDGTWRVDRGAAHAWVEVYFPTYGWVEFDPTPGNSQNGQVPTLFPAEGPLASPGEGVGVPGKGEQEFDTGPPGGTDNSDNPLPTPQQAGGPDWTPIALGIAGLVLILVLLVLVAFRRLPRAEPELAYRGIASLARRLGYGPRPAQTAYEFAAGLGELVPAARSDLQLIATAKVEATYGRRLPGESILRNLARAYRHVRVGMLRLLLRRPRVGGGPRPTKAG